MTTADLKQAILAECDRREALEAKATKGPWRWQGEDYRGGWGWQLLVGPDGQGIIVGEDAKDAPSHLLRGFMPVDPEHCVTGMSAEDKDAAHCVHIQESDAGLLLASRNSHPLLIRLVRTVVVSECVFCRDTMVGVRFTGADPYECDCNRHASLLDIAKGLGLEVE